MILTFKFRIKDASARRHLAKLAVASNQVWNYCVATQRETERRWKGGAKAKWPTHFDLVYLTLGCATDLGLHSDTVNAVCARFVAARNQHRKCPHFRASFGARAALGWVPYVPRAFKLNGNQIAYKGRAYHFWKSREIPEQIKSGAFVCDALGRWYVTFACEVAEDQATGNGKIGIDLGLKSFAAISTGEIIEAPKFFRRYEVALAVAQRAGNNRRAKAVHAKIVNARTNFLHRLSTRLARENGFIAVGNVNASGLAKTRMAKSVLDAGWSSFRNMLAYKARRHRACFVEADERWTTQTCSSCGSLPPERPKGIAGLGMRHWECSGCGASHDRDVNSALNILRVGLEHGPLVGEIRL